MEETTKNRRVYVNPQCAIITVQENDSLMDIFSGQQHNPAQPAPGPTPLNSKQGLFFEEEEDAPESGHKSLWDD